MRGPKARGEYQICCPFCETAVGKADTKWKLQINPAKGVYNCYRCGAAGRGDFSWLVGLQPADPEAPTEKLDLGPPESFTPFDSRPPVVAAPYITYLRERRLYDAAVKAQAGFCTEGRFAGRVVVPHGEWGDGGKFLWQGFSARAIYLAMEPKYLYPRGMDRKTSLWGGHLASTQEIWLVEGVFDALALFPYAVAAFGKNVTDEQLDRLIGYASGGLSGAAEIYVCLDGDAWEECQALAARLVLRDVERVHWVKLPPGQDPGSLGWKVREYVVRG